MDEVLALLLLLQRDAACNFVLTRSTGQTIMDDTMPAIPPHTAFLVNDDDVVVAGILSLLYSSHNRVVVPYVTKTDALTNDAMTSGGPIPAHKLRVCFPTHCCCCCNACCE